MSTRSSAHGHLCSAPAAVWRCAALLALAAALLGALLVSPALAAAAAHPAVDEVREHVRSLEPEALRPPWRRSLLAGLDAVDEALRSGAACAASDRVLAALDDLDDWRAEIRRPIEAPVNRRNPVPPQQARLAVLDELHARHLRLRRLVMAERPAGAGCGGHPTVAVDSSLTPTAEALPGFIEGDRRPLAAMVDSLGVQVDFVADELMLVSDDAQAGDALAERWGGTLLQSDVDDRGRFHSLIRVPPPALDGEQVGALLAQLRPGIDEALAVSSEAARQLLTAAALEALAGTEVGLNFVAEPLAIADGSTTDAPEVDDDRRVWTDDGIWSPNAFDWVHFKADSVQGIGVPEAWQFLEQAGHLRPGSVGIGIIDMGFRRIDMPEDTLFRSAQPLHSAFQSNRYNCSGGNPCPWHGTTVAQIAGGELDNDFGAAGTGAPVARLINVFTLYDAWSATIGITNARDAGASVINMSFSSRVPSIVDWGVGPSRIYTENLEGPVLITSAGNAGENVDAEQCFGAICWESHFYWPCESERVICVGGLDHNSLFRHGSSNWGHPSQRDNTVDIFAPFINLVAGTDPDPDINLARPIGGTSGSAPYVAGVVALMRAASPGLSKDRITDILFDTARRSSPDWPVVRRVVNAFDAVRQATPPFLRITAPQDGAQSDEGELQHFALQAHRIPADAPIRWTSNRDGVFGSGESFSTSALTPGMHTILARAEWQVDLPGVPPIDVVIESEPIAFEVIPFRSAGRIRWPGVRVRDLRTLVDKDYAVGSVIDALATSRSPTLPVGRADDEVGWWVNGELVATGHRPRIDLSGVPPGEFQLRFNDLDETLSPFSQQVTRLPGNSPVVNFEPPTPADGAELWVDQSDLHGPFVEINACGRVEAAGVGPEHVVWLTSQDEGEVFRRGDDQFCTLLQLRPAPGAARTAVDIWFLYHDDVNASGSVRITVFVLDLV